MFRAQSGAGFMIVDARNFRVHRKAANPDYII